MGNTLQTVIFQHGWCSEKAITQIVLDLGGHQKVNEAETTVGQKWTEQGECLATGKKMDIADEMSSVSVGDSEPRQGNLDGYDF